MRTILFLSMTLVAFMNQAQDTVQLSLFDAVECAIKNNREIRLAVLEKESATAKFSQTNAVFLPQINLSYTAVNTINPLNSFGFKLQQQSVSLSDFNPEILNNPSATQNYTTQLEWKQPLLNLDMLWQRRAADQQIDVYHYKVERTKEFVTYEVTKTFAQLQLAQEVVVVMEETLRTCKSIYENASNYFDKGLLQKSDLLLIRVQVTTVASKLAEAKSNLQNASGYMSLLMGVHDGAIYFVEPLEKLDTPENLEASTPENRSDFMALKSALKAHDAVLAAARLSQLPKLTAFGNYMLNDKTAFGFGSKSYLIGAQLSWTLFNGTTSYFKTAEQKIARDRIKVQLAYQREQSQLELENAYRRLNDTQVTVEQHKTSVQQAEEAFRMRNDRFQLGFISTNDLLQTQTVLAEQKLRLSEAVFNYNAALASIQFLLSQK
jgi:outer membrane protein TolC